MIEAKLHLVDEHDPRRCQGVQKDGQCKYAAMEGSNFCPRHGGNKAIEAAEKESLRQYRVAKWQQRIGEFADDDKVKGLREEIGVLRLLLEETLNMCKDSTDLLLYSSRINDTVMKIEKLVTSCHRLESATGALLDKTQALHLAGVIVEIIGRHVTDQEAVDAISNEIVSAIAGSKKSE